MNNTVLVLLLMTAAGAATALGSAAAFGFGRKNEKYISLGLSFAAGILFFTAVIEIIPEAVDFFSETAGKRTGAAIAAFAALAGFLLMMGTERAVPHDHAGGGRPGVFVAVAVGAHNFPEGMAAFLIASNALETGIPVIVAIAAHNVPLGMAISMPFCEPSGKTSSSGKRKAALCSLAAGMAGPLGALAGFLIFGGLPTAGFVFALLSAGTAGIMLYVAMMELVAEARRGASGRTAAIGFSAGAAAMGLVFLLLHGAGNMS